MTATESLKLRDGTEVLIRPMTTGDLEKSHAFFVALPEEDRICLRRDVTKLSVIQQRIQEMQDGIVKRLIALANDEIVADGEFGRFEFRIEGRSLPDNPRSSAITAMSVVREILNPVSPIVI